MGPSPPEPFNRRKGLRIVREEDWAVAKPTFLPK